MKRSGKIEFDSPINIIRTDETQGLIEFEYQAECLHGTAAFEQGASVSLSVDVGGDGCPIDEGGVEPEPDPEE